MPAAHSNEEGLTALARRAGEDPGGPTIDRVRPPLVWEDEGREALAAGTKGPQTSSRGFLLENLVVHRWISPIQPPLWFPLSGYPFSHCSQRVVGVRRGIPLLRSHFTGWTVYRERTSIRQAGGVLILCDNTMERAALLGGRLRRKACDMLWSQRPYEVVMSRALLSLSVESTLHWGPSIYRVPLPPPPSILLG
ncbi:hypothetical protein SUGI_1226070 [Cryptomeria japonica]|uniref:Uncharacterized protein n=1 Tax=Cryptomeria japonica TaxID=3369 RepID=A0AAD3NJJ7_CRYJA|nr:hypothetical protein SUGI_1226070 [Cryptomeria japonica]